MTTEVAEDWWRGWGKTNIKRPRPASLEIGDGDDNPLWAPTNPLYAKWGTKNPIIFECKEEAKRRRRGFQLRLVGKANCQDRRPIMEEASAYADRCRSFIVD